MTKIKISLLVLFLLPLLALGCVKQTTPPETALALHHQYNALEETYKSQYTYSSDAEREVLRTKVAPLLDQARQTLILYSDMVLAGEDPTQQRLEIIRLLRQASMKLTGVNYE